MTTNYILVVEDDKAPTPDFQNTRPDTLKFSKMSNRSVDIFSFSDQKDLLSRNHDFQDDDIEGSEAMVQSIKLIPTRRFGNLRFLPILQVVFRCLTDRLTRAKEEGFRAIAQSMESEIHISKLALSTIAKQRIIPYISQEILKRSKLIFHQQKPLKRSSPSVSREKSLMRLCYRFKLKIEKVDRKLQLKQGLEAMKCIKDNKIMSLKEIKKVESRGTFGELLGERRKGNSLQLKIIVKYIKKVVLHESFNKIKNVFKMRRIQSGMDKLEQYTSSLKRSSLDSITKSESLKRTLERMCKSINLHLIRIQYKLLIQAFYSFKSYQPQTTSVTRAMDKLSLLFNTKSIKFIYSSFLKLKDNTKDDLNLMKQSNGFFNFSELMDTKTRSRIENESQFGQESVTFRKIFHSPMPEQSLSKGFIEISSCVHMSFSKHQLPLPPEVFCIKPRFRKYQPLTPDTYTQSLPESD